MEEKGWIWRDESNPTHYIWAWDSLKEKTCIEMNDHFRFGNLDFYKNKTDLTKLTFKEAINFLTK